MRDAVSSPGSHQVPEPVAEMPEWRSTEGTAGAGAAPSTAGGWGSASGADVICGGDSSVGRRQPNVRVDKVASFVRCTPQTLPAVLERLVLDVTGPQKIGRTSSPGAPSPRPRTRSAGTLGASVLRAGRVASLGGNGATPLQGRSKQHATTESAFRRHIH